MIDDYKTEFIIDDHFEATLNAGLIEGMAVKRNSSTGKLVKATGADGEKAMFLNDREPRNAMDNFGKCNVWIKNGIFFTDQYKTGVNYTMDCDLQVSTTSGEEGILTIHAGGSAPKVGVYGGTESRHGRNMIKVTI
jgi:hypothetical protein